MNVLMVFPKYDVLSLMDMSVVERFMHTCDRFVNSAVEGRHSIFMLAEDSTARMLKDDIPKAHYLSVTNEVDRDLVGLCPDLEDLVYPKDLKVDTYAVGDTTQSFADLNAFEDYYLKNIQDGYEALQRNMNLVIEFVLPNKHMRFKSKKAPENCFYYRYDISKNEGMLYVGDSPNEELTEQWRGGIPHET